MCGLVLGLAGLLGLLRPFHLGTLPHLRLAEDGQQNDSSFGRQPVGNPDGVAVVAECEPQLTEPVAEVSRVRLAQGGRCAQKPLGGMLRLEVVAVAEGFQPLPDLWFDLDDPLPLIYRSIYILDCLPRLPVEGTA